MNKIKVGILVCLFLCLIFPSIGHTQPNYPAYARNAYNHILNYELEKARKLCDKHESIHALYLIDLTHVIEVFFTEDPRLIEKYTNFHEKTVEKISSAEVSPFKNLYLAEIKLKYAFIQLKLGNEWSATWQLRQAFKLIEKNVDDYPGFIANQKTMGLLNILVGSVPDQYQWIMGLLGMKGDFKLGLEQLSALSHTDHIYNREATILLAFSHAYLLDNATKGLELMKRKFPLKHNSSLVSYLYIMLYQKSAQTKKAIEVYDQLKASTSADIPVMYDYMMGDVHVQLGNYQTAISLLQRFLKNFTGSSFIKDSYYKIYLSYYLMEQNDQAEKYKNLALKNGSDFTEADRYAKKMLKGNKPPNRILLQIRFFTDAGEFNKAQNLILMHENEEWNSTERLEFTYRKARLLHKQGNYDNAIKTYVKVISLDNKDGYYYIPNACLQLGYIYKSQNMPGEARVYFKKVLDYSDYQYERSIKNKAKTALVQF